MKKPHEWVQGHYGFYGAFGSRWFKTCSNCRVSVEVPYEEWRSLPVEMIEPSPVKRP